MDDYVQTLAISECFKHVEEHVPPSIALTQTDDPLYCVLRYVAGYVDQVIDNRAVASALYHVFKTWVPFSQGFLTDHAKDVEGQNGQFQNKVFTQASGTSRN